MLRITFNIELDDEQRKLYPEDDFPALSKNLAQFFENVLMAHCETCSPNGRLADQLIKKLIVAIVPDQAGKPAEFLSNNP